MQRPGCRVAGSTAAGEKGEPVAFEAGEGLAVGLEGRLPNVALVVAPRGARSVGDLGERVGVMVRFLALVR